MSAAKRKVYGAAFKGKVGLEAIRGLKTINEIAQEHGVHPAQVGQWKKGILDRKMMERLNLTRLSKSTMIRSTVSPLLNKKSNIYRFPIFLLYLSPDRK